MLEGDLVVAERPYKTVSTAELYEKKRYTEKDIAEYEREAANFVRQYSQPGRNNNWVYEEPDYLGPVHSAQQLSKQLAEIEAELLERSKTPSHNGPREKEQNLVAVTCDCQPPRRFELPRSVYDIGPITCGNCGRRFKLR
jgi:hypothetical protein